MNRVAAKPETGMYDVVVIGGGPAGISALLWCNSLGLRAVLLERSPELGGQLLVLYHRIIDYPGLLPENGRILRNEFESQITTLGLAFRTGCKIERLDLERLEIFANDARFKGRSVIVATGARKRRLGIPGENEFEGKGVSFSATRDHAEFAGREVVVIGGGDSAVENSLILARVCPRVTLIHRNDNFRARPEWIEEAGSNPRIEIRTGLLLREILGGNVVERIILEDVSLGSRETLKTQGVFIRLGIEPNTELLKGQVALDDEGYLLVDSKLRTSLPRVYGAGDVTRPVCLSIATAVGHGAIAAKAVAEELRKSGTHEYSAK
ncbi:MAG: FAD-dependent oxidoreductase [Acidobacteria bacterium]|nr:FAD-dependent oxidoreductase [Acidobacteriota bacterium]MCW5967460.1 FAD-dependent oxidoreductase [Blastocatellales bacterium]